MASNEIRVSVNEESVARAAATIREAGRQLAETIGRLESYAVEPWTIDAPQGKLIGYLDDTNQEHWVHENQAAPTGYRRLYVEKRTPDVLFGLDAEEVGHGDGCLWPDKRCIGHPA